MTNIILKNNEQAEFTLSHNDGDGAVNISSKELAKLKTVDTLADLRTIDYPSDTIWVSGYHVANDGAFGSNIFRLKGVKTTEVDNGGTIIISTINLVDYVYELQYDGVVSVKWFGANTNISDNRLAIQNAIDYVSENRLELIVSDGVYECEAWQDEYILSMKDNCTFSFTAGAEIKFLNTDNYNIPHTLGAIILSNVVFNNVRIDNSNIAGANAIGVAGSSKLTFNGLDIRNVLRDKNTGGGRGLTFQSYNNDITGSGLKFTDCTTGLDFHGRIYLEQRIYNISLSDLVFSNCEEAMSFYDLFDGNTGLDDGGDVQVAISNVSIHNCGKATDDFVLGGIATGEEGGCIISEQARSFSISDVTVYNDDSYGKIGGIFRGSVANCKVSNITAYADVVALVNLSPIANALPVTPSNTVVFEKPSFINMSLQGSCDYGIYHNNGVNTSSLFKGSFDIKIPTPAIAIVNSLIGTNSFIEAKSLNNGSSIKGFSDSILVNNSFSSSAELIDVTEGRKKNLLHIEVDTSNSQLRLERTGTSPSVVNLFANGTAGLNVDSALTLSNGSYSKPFRIGIYRLWVSSDGKLRINPNSPVSDTDGTIVGTQA